MTMTATEQTLQRLGAGRSGEVFLVKADGRLIARKIFAGDRLGNLVHYVCFGAPNPYIWNEDALACAHHRRRILRDLIAVWFGAQVQVADSFGYAWNGEQRAWQLDTEYVEGRAVRLLHPLRTTDAELAILASEVMPHLQQRLIDAGLDGIVWQAGKGNPVALNNFLLVGADADPAFCFIDLESGVPALAALNPLAMLQFYLPRSFRFRRALFDDVDIHRLRRYVANQADLLTAQLGARRYHALRTEIDQLAAAQQRWKSQPRHARSIAYQLAKGRITPDKAAWYNHRPLRWMSREAVRVGATLIHGVVVRLPRKIIAKIAAINVRHTLEQSWKLIRSQEERAEFARNVVRGRLAHWHERGQLSDEEQQMLLADLEDDAASAYLTDFGAHIGLKVTVQALEITLFSVLFAAGLISGVFLALLIAADGLIYRSLYTLYRSFQAAGQRQPIPWMALLVGLLPLVGSLAFPVQMIWSAVGRDDRIARFIVYDTFTRIGAAIPIWGGADTRTEHFFNRIAHRLLDR